MVDILHAIKLQADKTLIAPSEGFAGTAAAEVASNDSLGFGLRILCSTLYFCGIVSLIIEVIPCSTCSSSYRGIE